MNVVPARGRRGAGTVLVVVAVAVAHACVSRPPDVEVLRRVSPETVGMSSERLQRLHTALQALVDEGQMAGYVTALARHGAIADFATYGVQDLDTRVPMEEDTIFGIASMTKPITGVAMMMLYEEGRFALDDPVARFIPEFAGLQVGVEWGPDGPRLEDPEHPMTVRELMTHTAGLPRPSPGHPADQLYREDRVVSLDGTLADMIGKIAERPLRDHPGTAWVYGLSTDVLAYLVEVLSGDTLDEFFTERIFEPLGMVDTAFVVPESKAERLAMFYRVEADGPLGRMASARDRFFSVPTFLSGGGGLASTAMDYLRFCQMLLNGGELGGVRLLSPTTVRLMTQNHLPPNVEYEPGAGFGLNFRVVLDPVVYGGISPGEYSWGGALGTWFWVDPLEDLTFVGMIQLGDPADAAMRMRQLTRRLTYQAIVESAVDKE